MPNGVNPLKISKENTKLLTDEIKIVRKFIREEPNFEKKTYYYSAIHGIVDRIMKLEYDPVLNFTHFVFTTSHATLVARIHELKSGLNIIPIEPDFYEHMDTILNEFEAAIKANKDEKIHWALNKIICLTSITMGPQYYLLKKGIKVVPD